MDVSIIIVNYNTATLLKACLESIYSTLSGIEYEVIVVDNDSRDNSREMVRAGFPQVVLIESGDNIGFGRANNLGSKAAQGKYLFFLNSDTLCMNNAVKILADYMDADERIAIAGGNLYTADHKPAISFCQQMPGLTSDIDYLLGGMISKLKFGKNIIYNYSEAPLQIEGYISGADMMIRKAVFDEVGGFDPEFFMYYEETELTWRVRKKGYKIVSVPAAKIIHLEGGSEQMKERTALRSFKSKYIFFRKTNKKGAIQISRFLFMLQAYQRIGIFTLTGRKEKEEYWKQLLKWEKTAYTASR
ncbi:glycosyltransferase family 2 protein [Chitinophaga sp. 22536]|uniref:glycosyltransferase family 2 protein n=1 Tax=unclassified Chitinophaga TaxID=2619133 RepID=UPI003F85EE4F